MGVFYTPVGLKAAAFVAGRSFGVESSIVARYAAVARVCRVVVLCRAQHCCGMFVANQLVSLASCLPHVQLPAGACVALSGRGLWRACVAQQYAGRCGGG
jgi:hypothetical protein